MESKHDGCTKYCCVDDAEARPASPKATKPPGKPASSGSSGKTKDKPIPGLDWKKQYFGDREESGIYRYFPTHPVPVSVLWSMLTLFVGVFSLPAWLCTTAIGSALYTSYFRRHSTKKRSANFVFGGLALLYLGKRIYNHYNDRSEANSPKARKNVGFLVDAVLRLSVECGFVGQTFADELIGNIKSHLSNAIAIQQLVDNVFDDGDDVSARELLGAIRSVGVGRVQGNDGSSVTADPDRNPSPDEALASPLSFRERAYAAWSARSFKSWMAVATIVGVSGTAGLGYCPWPSVRRFRDYVDDRLSKLAESFYISSKRRTISTGIAVGCGAVGFAFLGYLIYRLRKAPDSFEEKKRKKTKNYSMRVRMDWRTQYPGSETEPSPDTIKAVVDYINTKSDRSGKLTKEMRAHIDKLKSDGFSYDPDQDEWTHGGEESFKPADLFDSREETVKKNKPIFVPSKIVRVFQGTKPVCMGFVVDAKVFIPRHGAQDCTKIIVGTHTYDLKDEKSPVKFYSTNSPDLVCVQGIASVKANRKGVASGHEYRPPVIDESIVVHGQTLEGEHFALPGKVLGTSTVNVSGITHTVYDVDNSSFDGMCGAAYYGMDGAIVGYHWIGRVKGNNAMAPMPERIVIGEPTLVGKPLNL